MIDDFHLLAYRLFVDGFKDFFHKFHIHAALSTLDAAFFQNLIVTSALEHCGIVFFLVRAYFACDAHPLGQVLDDIVVTLVNLLA